MMVSFVLASKPVAAVGGACGIIAELASRLSEVIKGVMAFGKCRKS